MSSPASYFNFTQMPPHSQAQNPLPMPAQNSILQWLVDRIPERRAVLAVSGLILDVGEGGRIFGLEISSPDPLVTRRMHTLLGGKLLPEGLSLPPGRYELGDNRKT